MAAIASRLARRPVKTRATEPRRGIAARLCRAAASNEARTIYVAAGLLGLSVLALALLGPRRLERRLIRPLSGAVGPQVERLWEDTRVLREQIGRVVQEAGPARDRLAQRLQSWIGHFRAS